MESSLEYKWSTTADGHVSNGTAESSAFIGLDVLATNTSGGDLTFFFDYEYLISARASGDNAIAGASMDVLDNFNVFDIEQFVDAELPGLLASQTLTETDSFFVTVGTGQGFQIDAQIFSDGIAEASPAAVPLPAPILLLGSGLAGLGVIRLRKRSA